ncbi:MAG: NAD(P)-dependent oxidoreductase [Cellvibrionaceae bacterium]|nr:NAD(P)-dependent oxidoreductase [Cellvibrionaceae bacterium]
MTKFSKSQINQNFDDLHKPLNRLQAITEASRCTYCYEAPCITACPTSIDIPTFIHQIRSENIKGAAQTILSENILGGTCARACPTEILCEQACVRNHDQGKPVEIGLLQRFAVDTFLDADQPHPFKRAEPSGKRVAAVGAGPAGLAFAHRAALLGHQVVIFEAEAKPGGLNEYGLAAYKMANNFAQREVDFLMQVGGIEIQHSQRLGDNLSLAQLRQDFDGVFIGVGLAANHQLGIPGENLPGVEDATNFIATLRQTADKSSLPAGENLVVIGGGNTAIDAAVQAKRLGSANVTLVYRRGEEYMGATAWEIDLARKNGVVILLWAKPIAIHGGDAAAAIVLEKTALLEGTLQGTGNTLTIPADKVLKAVGQKYALADEPSLDLAKGKIWVNERFETNLPGVFAGGDCVHLGEDLTVQAVEHGKRAAHAMGRYLFTISALEI